MRSLNAVWVYVSVCAKCFLTANKLFHISASPSSIMGSCDSKIKDNKINCYCKDTDREVFKEQIISKAKKSSVAPRLPGSEWTDSY